MVFYRIEIYTFNIYARQSPRVGPNKDNKASRAPLICSMDPE